MSEGPRENASATEMPASRASRLTSAQMARMSRLLVEALRLDETERHLWLDALSAEHQDIGSALREALLPSGTGNQEALATLPKIDIDDERDAAFDSDLVPGERIGPYELIKFLGAGGMAEVWLARRADGTLNREVALKLPLLTRLRRDLEPRFARERDILAGLSHPNIARLFDAGFAKDGQPYLALEYVVGIALTAYCDQHRMTLRQRLGLFRQALSAVQYAHTHLVIHRDLKPSNVLVTEAGQVQLLDFGIAKLLSEGEAKETELTQLSGRALTPDYAAPEQIAGAPITTAADVYALGVMLYEILTGDRPYRLKRDTRAALEEAILQVDPVPPSRAALSETAATARSATAKKLSRVLKGDLDVITIKALKKSPKQRYQTASALDEDIERFLNGDVVLAQPDSIAYRVNKFVRRHWVAITVVSALILTLAGGLAATSYEAKVASAQRDIALQAQLRSLTQTAAARLKDGDTSGALGIILDVLPHRGVVRPYTDEALGVFQQASSLDAQMLTIAGHSDAVISAALSPDGQRAITASRDNTARIWDASSGRQIALLSHAASVSSAAFSPDGRLVATASRDATARIWDVASGREVMVLRGHMDILWCVAFSPDGRRVVTASRDKTARIWDITTGQQIMMLSGHTDVVHSAAFSPDGHRVVTASYDRTVRIWDVDNGRPTMVLSGHTDAVLSALFSPDGQRLVSASVDGTARTWDAATGKQILLLGGHETWVTSAAFSPDGERIVSSSFDRTARIWDATTGRQILVLSGHTHWLSCAAFSADGRRVVTGSYDETARIWNVTPAHQLLKWTGHASSVVSAVFSPDNRRIVTASYDRTARIWDAATGQQLTVLAGHTDLVNTAVFSPDGRRVATASNDKTARIWDTATGRELMRLAAPAASNGGAPQAKAGDPSVREFMEDATFSPDGRLIVTSSGVVGTVWDSASGKQTLQLIGHTDDVFAIAFSPGGRRIVTASWDKTARLWDAGTGRQIMVLSGHTDRLIGAAFSPDGKRIVTCSHDKTARIWDSATGRQVLLLSGHTGQIDTAVFSPDGQRIVTASEDDTVRLWDASTGQVLMMLSGHTPVFSAAFSTDGHRIVTASNDKTVRIFDAHAPPLDVQLQWAEPAQFDPPSGAERYRLGLTEPSDVHRWPVDQSKCDQNAAAPYDPDRRARGVVAEQIAADAADAGCASSEHQSLDTARSVYHQGRVFMASGKFAPARQKFEEAIGSGYRSARIDLAMLLSRPDAGMLDIPAAISLYTQAWNDGVTIAAFELGDLFERGVGQAGGKDPYTFAPDSARAWSWYSKAANAGDPNALARYAQKSLDATSTGDATKTAYLLEAFKYYAAAAERARREDWPDEAWRNWRYRRASLARLLAREGMMQEGADIYEGVQRRYATRTSTLSERLGSLLHRAAND
jgi:WD40 repeat protein/serine/threonine protein kinase/TPR repeat protein